MDWKPISTAPYTGDLELAVIEKDGPHTVGFPCHRVVGGWIAAETNKWIKGTSNNCHRSSGVPNLPANDSALFTFRFCAVHPKDVRDSQLRQLFEVPLGLRGLLNTLTSWKRNFAS